MLTVDDRFKSWMRRKLSDREYAEKVMRVLVDCRDCTLLKVHPHAALPVHRDDDPEVMIGLIKGQDNEKDEEFLLAIFGDWEGFKDLAQSYFADLWGMYDPVSELDFKNLPQIYEVAFVHSDSNEPLIKKRWTVTEETDGVVTSEHEYNDIKINLVNTSIDSEVVRIITGRDKGAL